MIAFEIIVNGESKVLAGVGDQGVLSSIISWGSENTGLKGATTFHVGGIEHPDIHVEWLDTTLSVGDKVEINIVELSKVDEPKNRKTIPRPDNDNQRKFKIVE